MRNLNRLLPLTLLLFFVASSFAQQSVTFDVNNLAKGKIEAGAGSMNLCWLLDSDEKRPRNNTMRQRITEMKAGSLRFPYGHLANNYLWDTPPYGGVLEPRIAASSQAPAKFSWAVNPDGSFIQSMDFDEFMQLSSVTNTEPLVVVNVLSYKYVNGPSYETLKEAAVEWVKYAKEKGYKVAFWQIGNEMDHHGKLMSKSEFTDLYIDFVKAMKAVDPTIKCGPGILSQVSYFNDIIAKDPSTVDFASVHQYLFSKNWGDYEGWRDDVISGLTTNVNGMQSAVNSSSKPDLPILVTETNAYGSWNSDDSAYLYKGLAFFDLIMEEQKYEDVKYTYMWNSHSPWGNAPEESPHNAWFNNNTNNLTSMGWAPYILNNTVEEKFMNPNNKVNGKTHSYGAYTPTTGNMVIYLLNKEDKPTTMNVSLVNYLSNTSTYERWVFGGTSVYDRAPTFQQAGTISFTTGGFTTELAPYSLTVVKLKGTEFVPEFSAESSYYMDNVGVTLRMESNVAGTGVQFTGTSETRNLTKWKLVSAGNGNYFIVNQDNNMRLRVKNNFLNDPTSINLVDATNTGSWVQWSVTKVGTYYFLDNVGHNVRLMAGSNGIVMGTKSETGSNVLWSISGIPQPTSYFMDNLGTKKRMKSTAADDDVFFVETTDTGWKGKWILESAGGGNYFIVNRATNKKISGAAAPNEDPASIRLVDGSQKSTAEQWKLTLSPDGVSYYLDNIAFDLRLYGSLTKGIALALKTYTGNFVRWSLTDVTPPFMVVKNATLQLDQNGQASLVVEQIDDGTYDESGLVSLVIDKTNFDCSNVGENSVTLTATDKFGNISKANAVVTVVDNIKPVVLTKNITVELDENGSVTVSPAAIDAGSSDACGIENYSLDVVDFDCTNVGENTVTFTVTDKNGNSNQATAVVTVNDNTKPVVLTKNITVELSENGTVNISPSDIDAGSFDACGIAFYSLSVTNFDCSKVGEHTVTLTVTDKNGNSNQATAVVTVKDNIKPVPFASYHAQTQNSYRVVFGATDNCDNNPTVKGIILLGVNAATKVQLEVNNQTNVKFEMEKNILKISAPDPKGLYDQIFSLGGFQVENGHTYQFIYNEKNFQVIYDQFGKIKQFKGPSMELLVIAGDKSGNSSSTKAILTAADLQKGNSNEKMDLLTIYPNPTNGNEINISFDNIYASTATVEILGSDGHILMSQIVLIEEKTQRIKLSHGLNLKNGFYLVRVISNNLIKTGKIIVNK